ncbi:hypothetical protein SLS55_010626 [Diplodia seriata]|uniref:Uncharacterized protein n=1 Tax=Diplodia seriata TaxID=420778 RepID=A0ABR3BXQ3_9PEZI
MTAYCSDLKCRDAVTIATYSALEIYLCLLGASYFVTADGGADGAIAIKKAAGSFAFVAGMLGYYSMGNAICNDQGLPAFLFPMGKVGFGAAAVSSSSKQEMRKSSIS